MKIKKKAMNKIHNEMVRRFSPYWDRKNVQMEELRADMASIRRQIEELQAQPRHRTETPVVIENNPVEPTSMQDNLELTWWGIGRNKDQLFLLSHNQHAKLLKMGVQMDYVNHPLEQETYGFLRGFRIASTIVPRARAMQFMLDATKALEGNVMFEQREIK